MPENAWLGVAVRSDCTDGVNSALMATGSIKEAARHEAFLTFHTHTRAFRSSGDRILLAEVAASIGPAAFLWGDISGLGWKVCLL